MMPVEKMKALLKSRGREVETYLSACLDGRPMPPRLKESMLYSLQAGGKRLRPVLCLSCAALCGLEPQKALPCAADCWPGLRTRRYGPSAISARLWVWPFRSPTIFWMWWRIRARWANPQAATRSRARIPILPWWALRRAVSWPAPRLTRRRRRWRALPGRRPISCALWPIIP